MEWRASTRHLVRRQKDIFAAMRSQVLALASHSDRIRALDGRQDGGQAGEAGQAGLAEERIKLEAGRTKQAAHRVPFLQQHWLQISQLGQAVEKKDEETVQAYDEARAVFRKLDCEIRPMLRAKLLELDSIQTHFNVLGGEIHNLRLELCHLSTFYEGFFKAHGHLNTEIQRRRQYDLAQQRCLKAAHEQLYALWNEEHTQRDGFAQEHGRFLPSSLCPQIHDPTPFYKLVSAPPATAESLQSMASIHSTTPAMEVSAGETLLGT